MAVLALLGPVAAPEAPVYPAARAILVARVYLAEPSVTAVDRLSADPNAAALARTPARRPALAVARAAGGLAAGLHAGPDLGSHPAASGLTLSAEAPGPATLVAGSGRATRHRTGARGIRSVSGAPQH